MDIDSREGQEFADYMIQLIKLWLQRLVIDTGHLHTDKPHRNPMKHRIPVGLFCFCITVWQ